MRKTLKKITALTIVGTILITTGTPSSATFFAEDTQIEEGSECSSEDINEKVVESSEVSTEVETSEEISTIEEDNTSTQQEVSTEVTEATTKQENLTEATTEEQKYKIRTYSADEGSNEKARVVTVSIDEISYSDSQITIEEDNAYYSSGAELKVTFTMSGLKDTDTSVTAYIDGVSAKLYESEEDLNSSSGLNSTNTAIFFIKDLVGKNLETFSIKLNDDTTAATELGNCALSNKTFKEKKAPSLSDVKIGLKTGSTITLDTTTSNIQGSNVFVNNLQFTLQDLGSGLNKESISVYLNDEELSNLSYESVDSNKSKTKVIVSNLEEKLLTPKVYKIKINACDNYGTATSKTYYYRVSDEDPQLSVEVKSDYYVYDNVLYLKSGKSLNLNLSGFDAINSKYDGVRVEAWGTLDTTSSLVEISKSSYPEFSVNKSITWSNLSNVVISGKAFLRIKHYITSEENSEDPSAGRFGQSKKYPLLESATEGEPGTEVYYTPIKFDSVAPVITGLTLNGEQGNNNYYKKINSLNIGVTEDTVIKSCTINGKSIKSGFHSTPGGDVLNVDFNQIKGFGDKDGNYTLKVKVVDAVNNTSNEKTISFKLDNTAPTISNFSIVPSTANLVETSYYLATAPIIKFESNDSVSGIQDVYVSYNEGKSKISPTKESVEGGNEVYSCTLSSSGSYSVVVKDKAGNTISKPVSELAGWGNFNNFVLDTDGAPEITIKRVKDGTEVQPTIIDSVMWFPCFFEYRVTASDESGINKVYFKVVGENQENKINKNGGNDNAISSSIPLSGLLNEDGTWSDGEYTFYAKATDSTKSEENTKEVTEVIHIDTKAPHDIQGTFSKEYNAFGDTLFFKESPTLNLTGNDDNDSIIGSGISNYILYNGDDNQSSENGEFSSIVSGTYNVEVEDKVGNTTGRLELSDIMNVSTSKLIVDSVDPTITSNKPNGDYNNWYAQDVEYSAILKDDNGVNKGTLFINGKEVSTFNATENNVKEHTIKGNTSSVKPNADGSYNILITVVDNAGRTNSWSDIIYIDKTAPTISKFVFTGDGYQEGLLSNTNGDYGFYFKGDATCEVYVSDGTASSGLGKLNVVFTDSKGKETSKTIDIVNEVAKFSIPKDFKGMISVSATDNVGNTGIEVKPDGVITESSNTAVNNIGIDISLPETSYKDHNGISLYNENVKATATIKSPISGIRKIKWGINKDEKGTILVDNKGKLSSKNNITVNKTDKNLVVDLSNVVAISENSNGLSIWVEVIDRAGYISRSERKLSIDKDNPIVKVTYDKNGSKYYNSTRVATISISERNFDAKRVKVSAKGGSLSGWTNNGDTWTSKVTYSKDGDYSLSVSCTDMAGNASNIYSGSKFTIDKTKPQVNVTWSNNSASNGKYYNSARTATITVKEHNFSAENIQVTGGSTGGWSNNGDTHTASISFSSNGTYKLSVSGKDNAGNTLSPYSSEEFVIDLDKPVIKIDGVQEGISYKKDIGVRVSVSDDGLDTSTSSVTIVGRSGNKLELTGGLSTSGGTIILNDLPKEEKYDNVYTLKAIAKDMAGNAVEEELVFSVNRFGSAYEFMTTDILGNYINESKDIKITESNVDEVNTSKSKVVVLFNGDKIEVPNSAVSVKSLGIKGNKNTYEYTINKDVFIKDGKYLVQIYSTNVDGTEYDSVTEEYAFVLDTADPKIIISGVESKKTYNVYEKKATVDVRDLSGVDTIDISLNGKSIKSNEEDGVYSFTIPEQSSSQDLVVNVTDRAGNSSEESVESFLVTSSKLVYVLNQWWFRLIVSLLVVACIGFISIILGKRYKLNSSRNKAIENDLNEYYSSTGSGDGEDE